MIRFVLFCRVCFDADTLQHCDILKSVCLIKAARTVGLKHVQCTEDDDFMAAFDKMMSETLQVNHCHHLVTWHCSVTANCLHLNCQAIILLPGETQNASKIPNTNFYSHVTLKNASFELFGSNKFQLSK